MPIDEGDYYFTLRARIEGLELELAAMRQQRDEAVEQYRDLLRRLSGSVSASPPRAAFLSGDASQKEEGGA